MLVVMLELHPQGSRLNRQRLGTLKIYNVGGTAAVGNYKWELYRGRRVEKRGRVDEHVRSEGGWALVQRVLADLAWKATDGV